MYSKKSRPGDGAGIDPMPALYQRNFSAAELAGRRDVVRRAIGPSAIALIQGAALQPGAVLFRQTNEFYYLTGIESPHAYLLIDGHSGHSTLFLRHRDERAERSEGRLLCAEDVDEVRELTGVEEVAGVEALAKHLSTLCLRAAGTHCYTPFQPGESPAVSRDSLLEAEAIEASDPWGGRTSRSAHFLGLLRSRAPQLVVADLSPVLDNMRMIKSERELALLRYAGWVTAEGITAAMRATRPGLMEYQLSAAADFVFHVNGARGAGYTPITASGKNAWHGHYSRQASALREGDLVLMDYAPDIAYYTSDIGRMWPVSGRFTTEQRRLYEFILEYHRTLLGLIKPGITADDIMDAAVEHMSRVLSATPFESDDHRQAAAGALSFRGHMSHPVGMCVHDVGDYRRGLLAPGMVISVDPMIWVESDHQYVRVEDTVAITEDGIENFTAGAPSEVDEIEQLLADASSGRSFAFHFDDLAI